MEEFEVKMDMLCSSLERKRDLLESIFNITQNQYLLLSEAPTKENNAMFNQMNAAKQDFIDTVVSLDTLFQSVFDSVSAGFEENALPYKQKVDKMQSMIRLVMDMDVQIRAQEAKNKAALDLSKRKPVSAKTGTNAGRAKLLKQYEKNKKPKEI